jgi:3-oxoadipate enol-lactonase
MEATVNGMRLSYQANGDAGKPALLLIHGFPLDSGMWEAQLAGLADRAKMIAPDLRGHGRSAVPDGPCSMEQHADDMAALLDTLGVSKAVVAGLSMGGYVAFAFWRRHPERVAALALLDTRATPDTREGQEGRTATIARVRERGVSVLVEEMMPRLLSPENQRNDRLTGALQEIILRQPAEGMIASLAAMRDRQDSTPTLRTITVPTYVIGGEDDIITPSEVILTMAKEIPDARSVLIVDAGHMSPMENPHEVNMALSELLSIARF